MFVPSNSFDDGCRTHAAARAHGDERGACAASLKLIEGGHHEHGSGCSYWVTQGDSSSIDIDGPWIDVKVFQKFQDDGRECLVHFPQVDVGLGHPCLLKAFQCGWTRAGKHEHRIHARHGSHPNPGTRLQAA